MNTVTYEPNSTALLLVDPYNDFLSEGGRAWPQLKEVIEENRVLDNMRTIQTAVRKAGIKVFFVPHRRWEPGDYESWRFPSPSQRLNMQRHLFARGEWGGEWHPDFVPQPGDVMIREHWAQSGFANTDLDAMLKQHGITHCILVGLLANTCIESTGRFGMELGYHVTLVTDATAAYNRDLMHAALRACHYNDGRTAENAAGIAGRTRPVAPSIGTRDAQIAPVSDFGAPVCVYQE